MTVILASVNINLDQLSEDVTKSQKKEPGYFEFTDRENCPEWQCFKLYVRPKIGESIIVTLPYFGVVVKDNDRLTRNYNTDICFSAKIVRIYHYPYTIDADGSFEQGDDVDWFHIFLELENFRFIECPVFTAFASKRNDDLIAYLTRNLDFTSPKETLATSET